MATGSEIEMRGHIVGFKEEIDAAVLDSTDSFFSWFDGSDGKEAAFFRGAWDFSVHIAPFAARYLGSPEMKNCLELGHGGGRLLAAAARHFAFASGVDIHDHNSLVENELHSRGIHNISLVKGDGNSIPVLSKSIDFVYSLIVLQHVEKISVFIDYLKEIRRILKPGGLAVIYFGRKYIFSLNSTSKFLLLLDRIYEYFTVKNFLELKAKVNCTNLIVSARFAKGLAHRLGFEVLEEIVSRRKTERDYVGFGGQTGLILKVPE